MHLQLEPIGIVSLPATGIIPRSLDEREGVLVIDEQYCAGLQDIQAGQRILVLFYFHRSPVFTPNDLTQALPHKPEHRGVFSLRSPLRPNPIGVTVVNVLRVDGSRLHVKGLDVFDGTPILDIKPMKDLTGSSVRSKISCV